MISREHAEALDDRDVLARFRERFLFSDDRVYLDGNSLGRLPTSTIERLAHVSQVEWGEQLIGSWSTGWLDLPLTVGDQVAAAVLGAGPGQVAVADSTTVNLFKLASAALDARPGRRVIVTDTSNFPSDRYVLASLAAARGMELRWIAADPVAGPTPEQVAAAVGEDTALVSFSHVDYRSAHIAEMGPINTICHDAGSLVLWDLSHSAGAVPLALDDTRTDLAVGCSYKYLNGGPGAPAYLYVRAELQDELTQPIWGWLGRADPFEMGPGYEPAPGIRSWLSGTPPILSLSAVQEGVALVAEAGIDAIRSKAVALTELAIALTDERVGERGVEVASPRDPGRRGAHVALAHPEARRLCQELIDRDVVVDFRAPDVIRIGLSPLTTRFAEVWQAIDVLRELLR